METMQKIDVKSLIGMWTRRQAMMFCKDIEALSQDQFVATNGGVTRSAQDITAEVAGFCMMVAGMITNPTATPPSEGDAKPAAPATTEAGSKAITAGAEALASAVENASDETLGAMVTPPWGGDAMPVVVLANIASGHIWYHDGQINYIQALNGDTEVHWM